MNTNNNKNDSSININNNDSDDSLALDNLNLMNTDDSNSPDYQNDGINMDDQPQNDQVYDPNLFIDDDDDEDIDDDETEDDGSSNGADNKRNDEDEGLFADEEDDDDDFREGSADGIGVSSFGRNPKHRLSVTRRKNKVNRNKQNQYESKNYDDDSDDSLFNTRRKQYNNKYGGNDAIKFVKTPFGRVGIVYETSVKEPSKSDEQIPSNGDKLDDTQRTDTTANNHKVSGPKITPVLTADGKVALLYRGATNSDSNNNKYEPIKNYTNYEFPQRKLTNLTAITDVLHQNRTNDDLYLDSVVSSQTPITTESPSSTTSDVFYESNENSDNDGYHIPDDNGSQLNVNKPLSEVLGIKKNQFTKFRIPESEQTSSEQNFVEQKVPKNQLFNGNGDGERTNYDDVQQPLDTTSDIYRTIFRNEEEKQLPLSTTVSQPLANEPDIINDILSRTEIVNLAIIPAFEGDIDFSLYEHNQLPSDDSDMAMTGDGYHADERSHDESHHRNHHHHHRHHKFGTDRSEFLNPNNMEDLSKLHCAMQIIVAGAALVTVFGFLGAYIKTRFCNDSTLCHW